jgi:PAS domain S-box-containing protein
MAAESSDAHPGAIERLERLLRESEERYALVSAAVAEGTYDWNIEDNSLVVSPRLMGIFSFTGAALTSGDWNARVHPDDRENYRAALRDCFKQITPKLKCEYRVKAADGTYLWVEDHGLPVRNEAGRAIRLVGAVNDISRRRETEQALRDSEQRHALAMQAVNEGVFDWNIATGEIYYSPRVLDAVGLTPAQLGSRADWLDRIHPDDIAGYKRTFAAHLKGETDRLVCEYRYRHLDGTWHWARQHGVALRDQGGRAYRMAGSTGDITAEKETARQRDALFQELNAVLDTIDYGVLFMSPDLRAKIINRAFRQMWGISDEFIRETRPTMADLINYNRHNNLYDVSPGEFDNYVALRVEAVRSGNTSTGEIRRRDGRIVQYRIMALPDGGRMLTYFDITDIKRSEEQARNARDSAEAALAELKDAQDRLVHAQKMASLGELTAGIAHEIKNPLNFVNNFASLSSELVEELGDVVAGTQSGNRGAPTEARELMDTLRGNLTKIVEHGKRADSIVKNMLLHARASSSEHRLADVNALVEESLNLAYHGARAEQQRMDAALEKSFDPAAGEAHLFPQEITRVLLNVISNGFYALAKRKAEDKAGNYESVLVAATKNLGDLVEIRIRDNGTGMPREVKQKIFDPFFTTKPPGEGTGLGLSLSYDIVVKQHGGSIEVETQPGEFTEFRIVLPRAPAKA